MSEPSQPRPEVDEPPAAWRHRISAGVIVEHEGHVLLVRHHRPGRYDFWVAPGGGVQGTEPLRDAAAREAREETGLEVVAEDLLYIEEMHHPGRRVCKFWFRGRWLGGALSTGAPEAQAEHIVEAAWLTRAELAGRAVFPDVLSGRYWDDLGTSSPVHLGLRAMAFW